MPYLLPFVYGRKFSEAISPAIVLIAGCSFGGLSSLLDLCMLGQGKPIAGAIGSTAASVTMAVAGWFLSRLWGTIGIAAAYVLSQFVYLCAMILQMVFHYENASLSDFIPQKKDIAELLAVAKKFLGLGLRQILDIFHPQRR
jgi:O-antigen/teichoic acid export membrane protein